MSRAFIQKRLPFKPTDIGGCQLWLDGADSTSASMILSGSTVSTWKDKSSNAYNFTQSSYSTSLPPLSNLANQQGVYFGSLQALYNTTYTFPTTYTIFSVANQLTRNSYQYILHSPYNADHIIFFGSLSGNFATFAGPAPSWNDVNANSPTSVIATTSNTASLLCCTNDGTTLIPYFNAVSLNTKVGTNATATGMTIGDTDTADARQPWLGTIGEIIIYTSILSDTNRRQVESYLAQKWGLQTSLPQGHPGTRGIVYPQTPLQNWVPWRYPSAFVPTSIGNCQIWLDGADSSTVILNGSTVSQWTDKSAAGNNATQPTAGNQPSYSASGIVFAGNQWLITPIGVNPTAESFFIVFKTTNNLAEIFSGTNANGREVLIVGGVMYLSKYGTNPVGFTPNGGSVPTNTVTLFDYQYTTSLVTLNLNGLQAGSGTPAVSYSGTGTSYIGSSTYAANNMYGTIYEIIYYNVSLTTNQFQQVEGYLAWKWALQANLPANHPYKNSSPSTTNPGGVSRPANLPVPPITIYAGPKYIATLQTRTFTYTGTFQSFTVPSTISPRSVNIYMWGAGGGTSQTYSGYVNYNGGAGAMVQGVYTVTPGSTLYIVVGLGGSTAQSAQTDAQGGGGGVNAYGGGGGGRSAIQLTAGGADVVVAGGGGGGGLLASNNNGTGGPSYYSGTSPATLAGLPAYGGSQTAGGAGTSSPGAVTGGSGSLKFGGTGTNNSCSGGGGYYGGGGSGNGEAGWDPGAGGSSLIDNLTLIPGQSVFGYNSTNLYGAPNTGSPYYQSNIAAGGIGGNATGGNGLVVITYYA